MSNAPVETSPAGLSPVMRRHHRWMFWIGVAAIVLAYVLEVRPDQEHVGVRGFPRAVVPGTCLSQEMFHHDCPGCGLTRSVIYFAHFNWRASWKLHHLGWLMALLISAQLPYRMLCLRYDKQVLGAAIPRVLAHITIVLLIGNWLLSLAHR